MGQQVQQIAYGTPSTAHGEPFQHLRHEHKYSNNERGEEFTDTKRCNQRDGHRKLHGHAALPDVLERLPEDRISAKEDTCNANDADMREWLPDAKPDQTSGNCC